MPEKKSKKRIRGPRSRIAILFAVAALVVLIFPLRTQGQGIIGGAVSAGVGAVTGAEAASTSSGSTGGTTTVNTPSDSKNLLECSSGLSAQNFVSCLLYFVTMLIVAILKLFVSLGAWLTKVGLVFSKGVTNSPAVQTGFSVSLSIANLGFVLGIIVVAIATILRSQTYGIKQILWKLVVAAILVNFSLVIAGVILGISDRFTGYFMEATAGGDTLTFVNSLASSFNPQALSRPPSTDSTTGKITFTRALLAGATFGGSEIYSLISNQLGGDGKFWSDMVQQLLNMVFVAVFLAIIALTFIALGIMLMIRYVYIGVLLVLAPLAWLAWIFPQFSSNFSKWWQQFLRWAFFPMFVTFFLYLAMATAINKDTYIDPKLMPTGNGPELSVAAQIGNSKILQNAGQMMIILGFALGGIFAANAMSIKGANVAIGAMKSVGTMTAGYVGKQSKKAGRVAFRAVGGEKAVTAMQKSGFRPFALAGRALRPVMTNEAMVAEAMKKVPDKKEEWEKSAPGSMNGQTMMAYLQKGVDNKWVKPGQIVNGKEITRLLAEDKAKFHAYGQDGEGKLEEKLRDATGVTQLDISNENKEFRKKLNEFDKKRTVSPEEIKGQAKLTDEEMKFYSEADKEGPEVFGVRPAEEKKRFDDLRARVDEAKKKTGLSPEEQKEYEEGAQKIADNDAKLKRIISKDPDVGAYAFQDDEAARAKLTRDGKPVPLTLQKESVENMRVAILRAFAEGFSPYNARALLDAVAKANNLKHFETTVNVLKESDKGKPASEQQFAAIQSSLETNKDLKRWMQANAGRALFGNLRQLFGLKPTKGEKKRMRGEEEEEEEETNEEI